MAISLITSGEVVGPTMGDITGLNTTGATVYVAHLASYFNGGSISDSDANTYTPYTEYAFGNAYSRMYVCVNPTPNASLTVTFAGGIYGVGHFAAFSGVDASPIDEDDGSSGYSDGSALISSGSITPSVNGCLIVAGGAVSLHPEYFASINSSLTIFQSEPYQNAVNVGGAMAWYEQPTASAINPIWTASLAGVACATSVISLKPSSGGGGGGNPWYYYAQLQ